MKLFKSTGKTFQQIPFKPFFAGGYEKDIEDIIEVTPALLGKLLIIGRQVRTEYGPIDLLALDRDGTVVIVELKRGALRREIVAQVNDYLTCVKHWNAYELEAKANLVVQSRPEERALVARFRHHFGCEDMPQLNKRQRIVLLAEGVDGDTLRALQTPQFAISVMTIARFHDGGEHYLAVDILLSNPSESESTEDGLTQPVDGSFFEFFSEVQARLDEEVFPRQNGWEWHTSRKWSRMGFSRWHQTWQGLAIGSGENDDEVYVGVIVDPKYAKSLITEFRADEPKIRSLLGSAPILDGADKYTPVWEHTKRDPDAVVALLTKYRDVFSPYLDRILPPRKRRSAQAGGPDQEGVK